MLNLASTPDWARVKIWRANRKQAYLHLALLTGSALFAAPFFWMLTTALKPEKQVFTNPPVWIPHPIVWSNYPRTFEFLEKALPVGTHDGLLFLGNTLIVAALSLAGILLTASMVAYSFARLRWPGRDFLFLVLLSTMMIPDAVTMIPRFMIFRSLGWIDTLRPLWAPSFFAGAFPVFLLRQFFLSLPNELEDAARIDGCGYWTTYWRVLLPQIKPALAALAILQFMGSWNDFMGPLIYISSPRNLTGSYALQLFQSAHTGEWTMLMCAATLWTLPVVLLFFFTQRHFIEGITLTGIKG
ncbi:MAG: carbohydrate ABC transporter permease [Chloroflexi bacterium]|nr:carbohydrate ABC transporter permease [Chloroflexota bacterium]